MRNPIACGLVAVALVGLSGCEYLKGASDRLAAFQATPAGKVVVDYVQGFAPRVNAAVDKLNQKLGLTADDVKYVCGGLDAIDTMFNGVALFAPIPSEAVEAEQLGHRAAVATCAAAQKGQLPSEKDAVALASQWTATVQALKLAVGQDPTVPAPRDLPLP